MEYSELKPTCLEKEHTGWVSPGRRDLASIGCFCILLTLQNTQHMDIKKMFTERINNSPGIYLKLHILLVLVSFFSDSNLTKCFAGPF